VAQSYFAISGSILFFISHQIKDKQVKEVVTT